MPRRTDNTWLERISGYLKNLNGVLSGSADNNAPTQKVGGVYNAATLTYADGSRVALQLDVNGNLKVVSSGTGTFSGSKTNNNAAPGATNVGVLPGIANAAVQTWTEGNQVLESMDLSGNERVTLGTLIAGEDLTNNVLKVEERYTYANIVAGQATTVVKGSAGFLHTITFNSAATATNSTIVYDNPTTSGTVIARPAATTATVPTTLTYDVSFATGLTVITTTANGSDMTVSYR